MINPDKAEKKFKVLKTCLFKNIAKISHDILCFHYEIVFLLGKAKLSIVVEPKFLTLLKKQ